MSSPLEGFVAPIVESMNAAFNNAMLHIVASCAKICHVTRGSPVPLL